MLADRGGGSSVKVMPRTLSTELATCDLCSAERLTNATLVPPSLHVASTCLPLLYMGRNHMPQGRGGGGGGSFLD